MYNKQVCRMKGAKEMLEIIGDSRAVARAAIQLAMTATREEETELKASLTERILSARHRTSAAHSWIR